MGYLSKPAIIFWHMSETHMLRVWNSPFLMAMLLSLKNWNKSKKIWWWKFLPEKIGALSVGNDSFSCCYVCLLWLLFFCDAGEKKAKKGEKRPKRGKKAIINKLVNHWWMNELFDHQWMGELNILAYYIGNSKIKLTILSFIITIYRQDH